jgi:hypothetical protein
LREAQVVKAEGPQWDIQQWGEEFDRTLVWLARRKVG